MASRAIVLSSLLAAIWLLLAAPAARFLIVRSEPLRAQALIVLSGSSVYEERLRHAANIYHERRVRAILLKDDGLAGRWSRERQRNPRSIERGRDLLRRLGVSADHVVMLPGRIRSTYDEALAARAYARAQPLHSLLIVTSAYHARRALWVFNRVLSVDGLPIGVDPVPIGDQSPAPATWWLSGRGWRSVGAEYPKFAYYLIAYR